jgi:hypothetical protein
MTPDTHGHTAETEPVASQIDAPFVRVLTITGLAAFGLFSLLISVALMKDLQTLASAPELIWAFVCGAPSPDGPALPLMLTISTLALLGAVVVGIWHAIAHFAQRGRARS